MLDRATMDAKKDMANKMAQIVYEGKWFTPLRAVQAFVQSTQEYVTGEVKLNFYKGNIIKAGTTSPYSYTARFSPPPWAALQQVLVPDDHNGTIGIYHTVSWLSGSWSVCVYENG